MNDKTQKLALAKLTSSVDVDALTTQQHIYERLRYNIMIGSIPPGTSLTIRGIAQLLDVSPTPVREALKRLITEGALSELNNRRLITPDMTLERFDELILLRIQLECHAAIRSFPYINEKLIDRLEEIDQKIDTAIEHDHHESIVVLNQNFHSTLYMANPNQICMPLIESIWLQLGPYTCVALTELRQIYRVDHHKHAIKSLRDRDADVLVKAIKDDIEDGIGQMGRKYLNR